RCYQCRNDQKHVCERTRILGVDVDGCFAEYVVVPETSAWKNDPSLPPEIACIQDPLGNAIHATLAGECRMNRVSERVLDAGDLRRERRVVLPRARLRHHYVFREAAVHVYSQDAGPLAHVLLVVAALVAS